MSFSEFKDDLFNLRAIIPNFLSVSRMAAPIVIPFFASSGNVLAVLILTVCFCLTDFFDGKIARALGGETRLGQLLDQISDKVCMIGLIIGLLPKIPFLAIPLVLEGVIAGININNTRKGFKVKSLQSGRIKMWPLSISLVCGYGMVLSSSLVFEILTYLGLGVTSFLEVINIKDYAKCDKVSCNDFEVLENDNVCVNNEVCENVNSVSLDKDVVYDYIENCDNFDDLIKLKDVIEPSLGSFDSKSCKTKKNTF